MSEPPVALGRGLLVTTGAIGCGLAVAVLWLLVPGGLDQGPVAGPTVTRSVGAVGGTPFSTDARAELLTPTTIAVDPAAVLPSESVPPATLAVRSTTSAIRATAVMIEGTGVMLTTAAAVRDLRRVSLEDASSTRHTAQVLAVSGGVALLAADGDATVPVDVLGFDQVAHADTGDDIVILAGSAIETEYPDLGVALDLGEALLAEDVPEGTPVVDADGALVGLCTHRSASDDLERADVHIVPIAEVLDSLLDGDGAATPSTTDPTTNGPTITGPTIDDPTASSGSVWVGVRLAEAAGGRGLLVETVITASPAETAGIVVGDLIIDIAGRSVDSIDDVRRALDGLRPGDTVDVGLLVDDGSTRTISVVLGVAAPDV